MIAHSLIDTDRYKYTMMQLAYHHFPKADVEYHFKCRDEGVNLIPYMKEIEDELKHYCTLQLQADELDYMEHIGYKKTFLSFLKHFKPDFSYVSVERSHEEFGAIDIVVRGPWVETILFEIPVLYIVNEVYYRNTVVTDYNEGRRRLNLKISKVKELEAPLCNKLKIVEFGTRRRRSFEWQDEVVRTMKGSMPVQLVGTSNLYLAKKYDLAPKGTQAHEYWQACQVLGGNLRDFQKFALSKWIEEYKDDYLVALTDVLGVDPFFNDFGRFYAKAYDGLRHDSGDPFEFTNKALKHYEKLGIDPKSKEIMYSDGLNFDLVFKLLHSYHDKVNVSFGIGTNLTNDFNEKALSIVMKMTHCNGMPVAKLSDSPGKTMCKDIRYIEYLKYVFNIK